MEKILKEDLMKLNKNVYEEVNDKLRFYKKKVIEELYDLGSFNYPEPKNEEEMIIYLNKVEKAYNGFIKGFNEIVNDVKNAEKKDFNNDVSEFMGLCDEVTSLNNLIVNKLKIAKIALGIMDKKELAEYDNLSILIVKKDNGKLDLKRLFNGIINESFFELV